MTPSLDHSPVARRWRIAASASRVLLGVALAGWCALLLAWAALQWWIVPRVEAWRPWLQAAATRALGVRVELQRIEVVRGGVMPQLALHGVRLIDAQGREALHVPLAQAVVSLRSLLQLGFEQLVVDGLALQVRRLPDGRLQVAGVEVTPGADDGALADWLFAQREVVLRGAQLTWIDEGRPQAPPLTLTDVVAVLRNPGWRHELRLDATPPSPWGQRLSWRARFTQPPWQLARGDWRRWSGPWYLEAPALDAGALAPYLDLTAWGLQTVHGVGAVRVWGDVRAGQWVSWVADVHGQDVNLRWDAAREPLALARMQGRVTLQRDGERVRWRTQGLQVDAAEGLRWPEGDVTLELTPSGGQGWRAWALQADRLDLAVLQRLGRVLPLGEPARWLDELRPAGVVQGLQWRWQAAGGDGTPARWSGRGRVQGLTLAAGPVTPPHTWGRPGVEGADAEFEFDERGGRAEVALRRGAITLPGGFDEPRLAFDQLQATLRWRLQGQAIELEVPRLTLANADAQGEGRLSWRTADPARSGARDRFPGVLDLDLRLSRADGARVVRYLPHEVGADVRAYLRDAIRAGRASDVRWRIQGDLWDFPFAQPHQGTFQVQAQLHDVTLDYAPASVLPAGSLPWPALQLAQAQLRIDGSRLEVRAARGSVRGMPGLQVLAEATIPDYMAEAPRLQVQGSVRGPLAQALRVVAQSPLQAMTGGALDAAQGSGLVEVPLELTMPLADTGATRVRGQVRLAGNEVQLSPAVPPLLEVRGTVEFTDQDWRLAGVGARALGGEVRLSGGSLPGQPQRLRVQAQGNASAEGLRAQSAWGWARWLGRHAQGSAGYSVTLEGGGDGLGVRVETDLRGLRLDLPAPLAKAAEAAWRTRVELQPVAPSTGGGRDRLRLQVQAEALPGGALLAEYEREHQGERTRVLRGRLALGTEPPSWPDEGVVAALRLTALSADGWMQALDAGGSSDAAGAALADAQAYWPTRLGVAVQRLQWGGRTFDGVTLGGSRSGDLWRLTVAARQADGSVELDLGAQPRVRARLSRLLLPPGAEADIERLASQPRALPAVDLVVDDFELAGRALGRLEVQAINRDAAQGGVALREWRLQHLQLTLPEARLSARGNWAPTAALTAPGQAASARRTVLQLRLDIDDAGALLERFGWPGTVRGGRGRLEGSLGWLGSPLALHLPSLSGELELDLQRGQFLKADPGVAKLLGVLSLQSLPRRLTLDFRDVFSEGFAFDSVRGHAAIARGVASTHNLQMKGVSAAVLLEGSADLVRETQDLTVVVVPELNAGTASLLASMVNPVTGLGTLLAQLVLRQPLQAAATQTFRITGSWADPQVERVARTITPSDSTANPAERTP
ncbi:YhdP family protein [Tepidimonas aquatica]|uniref:YhdP family protein n=1 Tax=Tepidimonas aquatica TaxID=247482 RepID=UPI00163D4A3A|nr:YhdP family protein [Tepidimonas aquatica]